LSRKLFVILLLVLSAPVVAGQETRSAFFETSDGIRIHYLEAGNGRPIVFIPGWTMPAWIWQKQIDEFSRRYHVIAIDPRSQGESDKPPSGHLPDTRARDYKELVDQLGLKHPVLVGWSMGCGELMKYVESYGTDNVGGLVLVDGDLWDKPDLEMLTTVAGWTNHLQQHRQKQTDAFVRSMYRKPQPEEYLQRVIEASLQVPDHSAVVLIYEIAVKDFSAAFARIHRPVLFAYQPQSQDTANLLESKLVDSVRLERFDGDGHALFVDDPDKFNRALEKFIVALAE
jgi:non-heme chloroperoxidase